ncbi:MAG: hypothetical protein HRF50_09970 [Phycisphaerae bacterium]|jgi:hypothetical protein
MPAPAEGADFPLSVVLTPHVSSLGYWLDSTYNFENTLGKLTIQVYVFDSEDGFLTDAAFSIIVLGEAGD